MNEFEEKLQAYRAQEKRKHQIEQLQNIILKPAKFFRSETKSSFEIIDDKARIFNFSQMSLSLGNRILTIWKITEGLNFLKKIKLL